MTILYIILGVFTTYSGISLLAGNWTWVFEVLFRILFEIPGMIIMSIIEGIFD